MRVKNSANDKHFERQHGQTTQKCFQARPIFLFGISYLQTTSRPSETQVSLFIFHTCNTEIRWFCFKESSSLGDLPLKIILFDTKHEKSTRHDKPTPQYNRKGRKHNRVYYSSSHAKPSHHSEANERNEQIS